MLELADRRKLPSSGVQMIQKREILVLCFLHPKLSLRDDNVNAMLFFCCFAQQRNGWSLVRVLITYVSICYPYANGYIE